MTEKNYGGDSGVSQGKSILQSKTVTNNMDSKKSGRKEVITESKTTDRDKILQAGKIASEIRDYAKSIVKKNNPLLEIAEKIETKIVELGGKPAFPVNLSINDIAAHYTPSHNDETLASGLLKVDLGVHIDGFIADTAFSVDLEDSEENKKLISASEEALSSAIEKIKIGISLSEIGREIQRKIESRDFNPIINLSGHGMSSYDLHSGITIPNFDDKRNVKMEEGLYAVEPFATLSSGSGKIYDGKPSEIYAITNLKQVRSQIGREILEFAFEEYQTLPFCSRWLVKKFGTRALLGLRELESAGVLHRFNQLVEVSHQKVSQAEHTILVENKQIIITTK